jgi:RimJ/RimL family protein N-acetyltransferase
MFTTERLRLRALKEADHEPILAMCNDSAVVKWLYGPGNFLVPITEDEFKNKFVDYFKKSLMFCSIEEKSTGQFVGFTLFMQMQGKSRNAVFGIGLKTEYHGKGYGKEVTRFMIDYAFRGLGVHRVSLHVFSGNERAIHTYKQW